MGDEIYKYDLLLDVETGLQKTGQCLRDQEVWHENMPATEGSINSGCDTDAAGIFDDSNLACSPSAIEAHCSMKRSDVETSQEQELQHASNMTSSRSTISYQSNGSMRSAAYRVDIADLSGEESFNLTTTHLKRCKRQVLRPYWRLLMFIGWRGFGREYVNSGSVGWKVLNTVYPMFIVVMLFYTYCYEIVACQWKLNIYKDTQVATTPITTTAGPVHNLTTPGAYPIITIAPAEVIALAENLTRSKEVYPMACEHIITTYVVPNSLHFVAFMMGLVHFRVQENEHLYALMENVFLQASPLHSRSASQQKLIRNMRGFFIVGAAWILITLAMQGLYEWAYDFPKLAFFVKTGPLLHWFLFCIELVGMSIVNSIFVAVVTNYFTQCQMILFYVRGIAFKLQEKSIDLKTAMKNIVSVKTNLSILNGPIARMTALVSVIFAELTIIGVSILVLNKNDHYKVWVYRAFYPVVWFIILSLPLMQAARVNSTCNRFQRIALETRVFGYKNCSLLELDSFLNFVFHARLRAKLFHFPILPKYLIAIVVLSLFVLLILLQTGTIGKTQLF
ncbi:uncharacterized protein LOC127835188 isoform X1 [Dreissena polymorpha]|uniref:uncharacterized protein LOC127835188 isoform X1 n=1 Tax=Dreissena polymorpha TaxID=45954 RepID=UPI0022652DD7|nr:uncharacterized protein LOC127835188 isoform X1 [Dreissena polymorpha]